MDKYIYSMNLTLLIKTRRKGCRDGCPFCFVTSLPLFAYKKAKSDFNMKSDTKRMVIFANK